MTHVSILIISLTIQLVAAAYAIRLIFVTGRRFAWIALAAAILLMSARRALTLYALAFGDISPPDSAKPPEMVALAISILMLVAVLSIKPVFDAAQTLGRVEHRLGRVLGSSLHEIYIFDAHDLRFSSVNHGGQDNLGYTMEELSRMTPVDLKPEFTESAFREMIGPLERGEVERLRFSTLHRRKNGTEYPVEVDLQLTREENEQSFIAVIHDASDKMRAEKALARSEAHFRSLIENAQDVITVLDEAGTILYHSPSIERVLGYSAEDRVGRSAMESVHPDDVATAMKTLRTVLETPGAHSVTYRIRHEDGGWRTLEAVGSAREGPDGSRQVIVNQRDVTERTHAEEQLRQAQKLETIGTLAGGIAHDFNNFLTPILGYAELIKNRAGESAPEGLDEIVFAAERAQQLVRQILTFSRRTETKRIPLDFASVVNEAVTLARSTLPASVEVESRVDAGAGFVLADRTQLHQVIMNMCANAHQAMPPDGGTLTIEVDREEVRAGDPLDPSPLDPGPYLTLTIRDTGSGMERETIDRVFEPFFTTKNAAEGTGLGLSVAHGIITSHGGDVRVESEAGEGTAFRIRLPRIGQEPETQLEVPFRGGGTERILVIDDDAAVARCLGTMLRSAGYGVTTIDHAQEALDLLERSIHGFDLVITDLTMPQMSGLTLATRMKELRDDLPIILMSGHGGRAGAVPDPQLINAILLKPFRAREVALAIRRAKGE